VKHAESPPIQGGFLFRSAKTVTTSAPAIEKYGIPSDFLSVSSRCFSVRFQPFLEGGFIDEKFSVNLYHRSVQSRPAAVSQHPIKLFRGEKGRVLLRNFMRLQQIIEGQHKKASKLV